MESLLTAQIFLKLEITFDDKKITTIFDNKMNAIDGDNKYFMGNKSKNEWF